MEQNVRPDLMHSVDSLFYPSYIVFRQIPLHNAMPRGSQTSDKLGTEQTSSAGDQDACHPTQRPD